MPSFDNAARGVRKIYRAEVLELISMLLTVLGSVIAALSISKAATTSLVTTGSVVSVIFAIIFVIAGLVIGIIAFINHIIGLVWAKKDDSNFGTALACIIIYMVIEVVSTVFTTVSITNAIAGDIAQAVGRVADFFSVYFILYGAANLLSQRGDERTADKGVMAFRAIFITFAISIALRIVPIFLSGGIIEVIFLCAYAATAIVAYILYLSFLRGAYKKLSDNVQ